MNSQTTFASFPSSKSSMPWPADGAPGEVELEQAYVQIDVNDRNRINAGLQLLPIGIINETHEPPTFFGRRTQSG